MSHHIKNSLPLFFLFVLSVSIFINQIYRVESRDLSRWKGGGMGMFSTVDTPSSRMIEIAIYLGDGAVYQADRKAINNLGITYRTEPSLKNLQKYCKKLSHTVWVSSGLSLKTPNGEYLDIAGMSSDVNDRKALKIKRLVINSWKVTLGSNAKLNHTSIHKARLATGEEHCHVIE
jgi:hypothetical protein